MSAIVSYLKRERERQNRSVSEVARTIGCSKSSLSEWERNLKTPSLNNSVAWAKALGCDLIIWNNNFTKE